jgi:CheY-like chemotaxis protein
MKGTPLVLVVDDAADNREGYAQYLEYCGFRTMEAATGEEALKLAREHKPDAILLDLRLPYLDGLDVARTLRAEGFGNKPIVAMSASVFEPDVKAALESGCDAFLAKPCLPETVVQELNRLLKARDLGS